MSLSASKHLSKKENTLLMHKHNPYRLKIKLCPNNTMKNYDDEIWQSEFNVVHLGQAKSQILN